MALAQACAVEGNVSVGGAATAGYRLPTTPASPATGNCQQHANAAVAGTWYLAVDGQRWRADLQLAGACQLAAEIRSEDGDQALPAQAIWNPATEVLHLQAAAADGMELVGLVRAGVLAGRARAGGRDAAWSLHATGWRAETFDAAPFPRAWDIALGDGRLAVLRIDAAPKPASNDKAGAAKWQPTGRFKVYAAQLAQDNAQTASSSKEIAEKDTAEAEELELTDVQWDGQHLQAAATDGQSQWKLSAEAQGRKIAGTVADVALAAGGKAGKRSQLAAPASAQPFAAVAGNPLEIAPVVAGPLPFAGFRTDVLGYGLLPKTAAERAAWQTATRARLQLLAMAGNPAPQAVTVAAQTATAPFDAPVLNVQRDDDPLHHDRNYSLREVSLNVTAGAALPLFGPPPAVDRQIHLVIAEPTGAPRNGQFPLAIVLNGHNGSARYTFEPNNLYWYGDALTRRGYLVVAVDVGHRPLEDRAALYQDLQGGDAPSQGNWPHPAMQAEGQDSDWQEDGERAWDAMRALDYGLSLPNVAGKGAVVAGLSLGGEVATWLAALDPRVTAAVVAGFSPDLHVVEHRDNHACWRWQHADLLEYLDVSDLHALVAGRGLLVETGTSDATFSANSAPFAADKQVLRRSRAAFSEGPGPPLVHYLHGDGHIFHLADHYIWAPIIGLTRPLWVAPKKPWQLNWQTDDETHPGNGTVLQWLAATGN